jgi:hypothetical protein
MSSTKKQARSASKKAAPKEAKAKNEKKQRYDYVELGKASVTSGNA